MTSMRNQDAEASAFEHEGPRLRGLAAHILSDAVEAEDMVQQAWLRLHATRTQIDDLPAWLTTVTVRLCLDRLRQRRLGERHPEAEPPGRVADPAEETELADTVGRALHVVQDRLTPKERVAFVLRESFDYPFDAVATALGTSPVAARKLVSRARAKVRGPEPEPEPAERLADWEVVDAFLAAAKGGDLVRLLQLLAPEAVIAGDAAATKIGTPERIEGRDEVAAFFNGAAATAFPVFVSDLPGAAWFDRGEARVAFDFTVVEGRVTRIDFRAEPALLAQLIRQAGNHDKAKERRHKHVASSVT